MGENNVLEKTGLWFLSEPEEGDEFKAEGRVCRIRGSRNRVQFKGTCILNNAPNRPLTIQGEATVNLAGRQPSTGAEEQESEETIESTTVRDGTSQSESDDGKSEQNLERRMKRYGQRIAEAIERGHVIEKRGGQFEEAEFKVEEGEQGFVTPENVGSPPSKEISPVRRGRINEQGHPSDVSPLRSATGWLHFDDDNDHANVFTPIPLRCFNIRDVDEENAELVSPIRCVTISTPGTEDEAGDDGGVFTPIPIRIQSPDEEERRLARIDRNLALIFDDSNGDEEAAAQDQLQDSLDGQSMNTPREITPERRPAKVTFKNTPQVQEITPHWPTKLKFEIEEWTLPSLSEPTDSDSESDDEFEPSIDEMVHDVLEEKTRMTVDMDAAKFTQAVIDTLLVRFLNYGTSNAEMENRQCITHQDLAKVVRDQPEMNELLKNVIIPSNPKPPQPKEE